MIDLSISKINKSQDLKAELLKNYNKNNFWTGDQYWKHFCDITTVADWEYISPGGDKIYRPKSIIIILSLL